MAKPLAAGADVDAYCTRCRIDLLHRIVAMQGVRIARVECLTCHGQHNYRRSESDEPARRARPARRRRHGAASSRGSGSPRPGSPAALRLLWERAIRGRAPGDFTAYSAATSLSAGQLVKHNKFGDGVVSEVIDAGKVQILFADGAKLLVHGRR